MKKGGIFRSIGAGLLTLTVLLSLVVCGMPVHVSAASSSELKEALDDLKSKNQELQSQIDALQQKKNDNLSEIQQIVAQKNNIDQEIVLLYEQLDNLNAQISAYNQLIADKQEELDEAEARLAELNLQNRARIRTMEAEGNLSFWSVLFKATSFSDLLDRLNMIQEIAEADRQRIDKMNAAAAQVAQAQDELKAEKGSLEESRTQLALTQGELDARRAEADALLSQLLERGAEYEALLDASEKKQDELMAEIAQKEKEYTQAKKKEEEAAKPPVVGGSNSGGWVIPCSYVYVSSPFKPERLHPILGYVRPHNGIDLAAYLNTPVYATRSGTVTTTAYQEYGAGNYVSINHGDGFASIYMHLEAYVVSPGQQVAAGQLIGYVGTTGLSEGPHLHFGISYHGTYVNPANYMNF